jgi:hypothetical protein
MNRNKMEKLSEDAKTIQSVVRQRFLVMFELRAYSLYLLLNHHRYQQWEKDAPRVLLIKKIKDVKYLSRYHKIGKRYFYTGITEVVK